MARETIALEPYADHPLHAWRRGVRRASPSRAGRLASSKTNADVGSQSASASLLLQEYEQRGVGWLWQVDGDNRVTYISSRMIALLGRSSSAILGHSLPALLGGHAELGRVLLGKQPFNSLEMELQTARGPRWISIAGDPIIDTAGRFEGYRGVGSDITEVRQTQERLTHLANVDVLSGLPNRGRVRQLLGEARAPGDQQQCAVRDHVPRPRRVQAGQRHLRPSQGRRRAPGGRQATVRRSGGRRPCRAHGRRRIRHRHHRRPVAAQGRGDRRADHQVDRRTLHDRPDRDPHRRVDRLRLRPGRRGDGRRPHPQGRSGALRSQGRGPRRDQIFLLRAPVRAGRPHPARDRPAHRDRRQAVPPRLPAAGRRAGPRNWSGSRR